MTTAEVSRAARAKIEQGWCVGTEARNSLYLSVPCDSPSAIRWCAFGAIKLVAPTQSNRHEIERALLNATGRGSDLTYVSEWNDSVAKSKEEVLAAFDRAIAAAEVGA